MTYVGLVSDRRGRWAEAGRRMAAAPHAPAAFAALLGALATAEAGAVLATRPGASSVDWSFVVVVVLVSLATTVPLRFLWAQPAAPPPSPLRACRRGAARLTPRGGPAGGAQGVASPGAPARAALAEVRRLLGVLREAARAAGGDRRPQPGLRQLNELLDEARDISGAGTRLIVSGQPAALDPGVELAAYRIVQEALTNARRHAPGAAVDVELRYAPDALWLRIRDNGPGPPPAPATGGHGLLGMRERAAAVGGELRTGAAAGGGFLVEAVLPATAEAAA